MHNAFTGISPHQRSPPGYTSIQLSGSRPEISPESIINIEPSRFSPSPQRESIDYSSIHGQNSQLIFQTPLQHSNFRVHQQHPAISMFSRQNITTPQQQVHHPIIREGTPIVSPTHSHIIPHRESVVILSHDEPEPRYSIQNQERKSISENVRVSKDSVDQQRQFYKATSLEHERKIASLLQELVLKGTIINQLQAQAVKIRGLEDNRFILQNKLRDSEREKHQLLESLKNIQIQKQKIERVNVEVSKNDEQVRIQIFTQISKLRRQLNDARKRQIKLEDKILAYEGQMRTMAIDKTSVPNVERILGDLEHREKQIIKLQQALTKFQSESVKQQILKNELNHKVKSLENTVQILQKQISNSEQNLKRKSGQLVPIKSLQNETEHLRKTLTATQTQLVNETRHLSLSITVKEQEITKLRTLLENQQLKFQQVSSRGTEGSRLLLKQIEESKDILYKRQMLIQSIQETLVSKERELGNVELENVKLSNRLKMIENEHQIDINSTLDRLRQAESKNIQFVSKIKTLESQLIRRPTELEDNREFQYRIIELTESVEVTRKQMFDSKREYQQRIFQLLNTKNELEIKIKQLAVFSDQKEEEKQYLETQNKTVYNNYIELRKQIAEFSGVEEENKLLKLKLTGTEEELYRLRGQIQQHRSEYQLSKQSSNDFEKAEQFNKIKLEGHNRDPQTVISALRNQNQSLKALLEDASEKIEEYSSAAVELQELQKKIMRFQEKAERFLGSSRGHQYYSSDQQHRVMLDQVVQEMSKKLDKFKRQNQQLKKQVKGQRRESDGIRSNESRSNELLQRKRVEEEERQNQHKRQIQRLVSDFEMERGKSQEREKQRIGQIKNKMLEIKKSKSDDYSQKIAIVFEENKRLTEVIQQQQNRIKEYQTLFLKFKNKQNRAASQTAQIQEKKEIEYQQQIIDNVEDITQIEERATFYKQKNMELETRVEQLLIINNELKTQLEEQGQTIKVFEGGNLYRYQIQILEQNISSMKLKLDTVMEENNRLRGQEVFAYQGMNTDEVTRVRILHLSNEVSTLRQALAEAHERNNMESVERHYEHQESSSLQIRIQELELIIGRYELQKSKLIEQNHMMLERLNNFDQPHSLLHKIGILQHQVQRLEEVNHRLNSNSGGKVSSQQGVLEAYHHLLNQVDKLLQRVDLVRTYTLDLVNLISENEQSEFVSELEKNLRKIADFLQDVDAIKHTISSIRRQQQKHALRGEATMYLADI